MLSDAAMLEIATIVAKAFELAGMGVIVAGTLFALGKLAASAAGVMRTEHVAGKRDGFPSLGFDQRNHLSGVLLLFGQIVDGDIGTFAGIGNRHGAANP